MVHFRMALAAAALLATTASAAAQPAPLKVVVTIKPVHALVAQVMDGLGTPRLLVDGAASPHTFALKPSDAKALAEADVVFRVSENLEGFTARIARGLPKSVALVTLEMAAGVERLPRRTGGTFEAHVPGKGGHEHGVKKSAAMDPHVWLDPVNAKAIVAEIARSLAEKRPADAPRIKENADTAIARLDRLAAEMQTRLAPAAGKPYVVFHDALQYLERRFGLTPAGAVTADPETPPSGKRLADLRKKVGTLGATCAFSEPNFETRVVQSIIEGTSAKAGVLDPEGATVAAGHDAYDKILFGLADALAGCLAPRS